MSPDHIPLRAARDRLIDFLAFGQTAPLQDLDLPAEKLTVPYNTPAEVTVENSQAGVWYALQYPSAYEEGERIDAPTMRGEGMGGSLILKTPPITEDVTFSVYAVKLPVYLIRTDSDLDGYFADNQFPPELTLLLAQDRHVLLPDPQMLTVNNDIVDDKRDPEQSYIRVQSTITGSDLRLYREEADTDPHYAVWLDSSREVLLLETASVKVDLNRLLAAWVAGEPHLDPTIPHQENDRWPRIVSYSRSITVKVANSQEGVRYKLVSLEGGQERDLSEEVTGTLQTIALETFPLTEDVDILIRATKSFAELEDRPDETTLLEAVLPVRVRANSALSVWVEPESIIDYDETATIGVAEVQESAAYQLFIHAVQDHEFRRLNSQNMPVVTVPVPNEPDVNITTPESGEVWQQPENYQEASALQAGADGTTLFLETAKLNEDSLLIVRAQKEHAAGTLKLMEEKETGRFVVEVVEEAEPISSAVQLKQPAAVLVRPNPVPALRAETIVGQETAVTRLQLFEGQSGVFYHLVKTADGSGVGRPAYFHQRDTLQLEQNKGLGQIEIGVDFVPIYARLNLAAPAAEQYPAPPILDLNGVSVGDGLSIVAQKAQTRVTHPLGKHILLHPVPDITPENAVVDYNGTARILIDASVEGERYELWLDGQQVGNGRNGNGQQRTFVISDLTADTVYEVRVTRPQEDQIPLTRIVPVPLLVRPNGQLTVTVANTVVLAGASTAITIADTQSGVDYQLLVAGEVAGDGQTGTGGALTLETPPLVAETTFTIRAMKQGRPDIFTELAQQITVQVEEDIS